MVSWGPEAFSGPLPAVAGEDPKARQVFPRSLLGFPESPARALGAPVVTSPTCPPSSPTVDFRLLGGTETKSGAQWWAPSSPANMCLGFLVTAVLPRTGCSARICWVHGRVPSAPLVCMQTTQGSLSNLTLPAHSSIYRKETAWL